MLQLITMLTHNDTTVKDAKKIFAECADLDCEFWGFKDIGLPQDQMRDLVSFMKDKGKKTFLEVVTLTEEGGIAGAELAISCGFDYLVGTIYHDSIMKLFSGVQTQYCPFVGKVHGHPSILEGTPEEITAEALAIEKAGVHGIDILAYRNKDRPAEIIESLVKNLKIPVTVAGSINDFARIDEVKKLNAWAFTIGGAFFDQKFVPGGDFKSQIKAVLDHLKK